MAAANQEIRTFSLQGSGANSDEGRPIGITSSTEATPTQIHVIAASGNEIDTVFMRLHNNSSADVSVTVCIQVSVPSTPTFEEKKIVNIPAFGELVIFDGERFVQSTAGANTYAIAAFVGGGDTAKIFATGWVNRIVQPAETP